LRGRTSEEKQLEKDVDEEGRRRSLASGSVHAARSRMPLRRRSQRREERKKRAGVEAKDALAGN
jgi:hypothetical protein